MPAQWQKYPLSTQLEMMAGRNAIGPAEARRVTIVRWADEGSAWLRANIPADDLGFTTSWDVDRLEITLEVFRRGKRGAKRIFQVTEPAHAFVSHLTVTKILMIS